MGTEKGQEMPGDRGEGKIAPRTEGKAEGERDESATVTDTDVADAADEAGSAFLPHDKVLSDPNKRK